ncbi:MAG: methyltransferase domain-containing protein [Gemmatimonadales bacterium]
MTGSLEMPFGNADVATHYDEILVPRLFAPWAETLVARLAPAPGIRALDVGTGPGTAARALARALGPEGRVAGCDLSASMIARAEGHGPEPGAAPIAYTVSPAAPLPYPGGTFRAVTCQQALQFLPDALAALAEMHRVLEPGGRLAVSVWQAGAACAPFHAIQRALQDAGQPDFAELMRLPFPHWSGDDLGVRAREAGFGYVQVHEECHDLVLPGGVPEAIGLMMATPIGPMVAGLPEADRRAILASAERAFAPLAKDGVVRGPMTSWILIAAA